MRAVRFTKTELLWIRNWLEAGLQADVDADAKADVKLGRSVLAKLTEAESAPAGTAAGPLERALVGASRGKVVELASGPSGYARASKMASAVKATVEDMAVVGAWLARQGWLREPTTLLGVLNKWAEWLPRARATQPPPSAPEGFSDGVASAPSGTPGAGGRGPGRATPPGFR